MCKIDPNVAKAGGLQRQGAEGEAVMILPRALGNAVSEVLRLSRKGRKDATPFLSHAKTLRKNKRCAPGVIKNPLRSLRLLVRPAFIAVKDRSYNSPKYCYFAAFAGSADHTCNNDFPFSVPDAIPLDSGKTRKASPMNFYLLTSHQGVNESFFQEREVFFGYTGAGIDRWPFG